MEYTTSIKWVGGIFAKKKLKKGVVKIRVGLEKLNVVITWGGKNKIWGGWLTQTVTEGRVHVQTNF